MQKLIDDLAEKSNSELEAIYNHAWRNNHNGIDSENANILLQAIQLVCGFRAVAITGRGGAWEFKDGRG